MSVKVRLVVDLPDFSGQVARVAELERAPNSGELLSIFGRFVGVITDIGHDLGDQFAMTAEVDAELCGVDDETVKKNLRDAGFVEVPTK